MRGNEIISESGNVVVLFSTEKSLSAGMAVLAWIDDWGFRGFLGFSVLLSSPRRALGSPPPNPAVPWPLGTDRVGDVLRKLVTESCGAEPVEVLMWTWDRFQRGGKEDSLPFWWGIQTPGRKPSILPSYLHDFICEKIVLIVAQTQGMVVPRGHGLFFSNWKEVWRSTMQGLHGGPRVSAASLPLLYSATLNTYLFFKIVVKYVTFTILII